VVCRATYYLAGVGSKFKVSNKEHEECKLLSHSVQRFDLQVFHFQLRTVKIFQPKRKSSKTARVREKEQKNM
jgi:hypothetical protein